MPLYYEAKGGGRPVVFLHHGIADRRVWEPQWQSFPDQYRLLRLDLPGFGRTPIESMPLTYAQDVSGLLDELGITRATVVGCSLGGRVALELAVGRPDLVGALVLVGAPLPRFDWSETVRAYGQAEDEAVAAGNLDAATELNLRMWVDGPNRKPADVDATVRAAVSKMQHQALELQAPFLDGDEQLLVPDLDQHLSEISAPTLVLVGEGDVADIHQIAELLVQAIPDARLETIPGTAHVPNLEQPDRFNTLVLEFLGSTL